MLLNSLRRIDSKSNFILFNKQLHCDPSMGLAREATHEARHLRAWPRIVYTAGVFRLGRKRLLWGIPVGFPRRNLRGDPCGGSPWGIPRGGPWGIPWGVAWLGYLVASLARLPGWAYFRLLLVGLWGRLLSWGRLVVPGC